MPSKTIEQQRLFEWALSCKRGTSDNCPPNVEKLVTSMSEEELEKYASTSHEDLPHSVKESLDECLKSLDPKDLELLEAQDYSNTDDVKTPPAAEKNPPLPGGYPGGSAKREPITPSLFKAPMGKAKHERRIMDFDQFLDRINYKTHDGTLQKGHGQNLTGKG
jgi:hypothetical protein